MYKIHLSFAWFLILFCTFSNCTKKENDPSPEPSGNTKLETLLNPNTQIISETDQEKVLGYDTINNILELATNINPALIKKDAVLACGPTDEAPDGFLVKVVEVLQENGTIQLKTTPVFLEDAFQDLQYSTEFTLSELESNQRVSAIKLSIEEEMNLIEGGAAKLKFKSEFEPTLKFDIRIEKGIIKEVSIKLASNLTTNVALTATLESQITILKNILHKKLKNITFFIPTPIGIPFPVVIGNYLTLDIKGQGKIGAGYQASCTGVINTSNTIAYKNSWSNQNLLDFKGAYNFDKSPITGELEVSAIPGIKFRFYESDKAYGRLNFPISLNYTQKLNTNPDKELTFNVKANLQMHISNLANYNTEFGIKYSKLLKADYFVVKKKEGDQNEYEVGVPLDTLLTVSVTDSLGEPREGVKVSFKPEGGSVFTVTTGADGLAKYAYVPLSTDEIKIFYSLTDIKNEDGSIVTGKPDYFKLEKLNLLIGTWKAQTLDGKSLGIMYSVYGDQRCPSTRTGSERINNYTLIFTKDSVSNAVNYTITNGFSAPGANQPVNCSTDIIVDETLRNLSDNYKYAYKQNENTLTINDQFGTAIVQITQLDNSTLKVEFISGDGDILEHGTLHLTKVNPQ